MLESEIRYDDADVNGSELMSAAEQIGWPKPVDWSVVQEADRVSFAKAFRRLLELQTTCVSIFAARRVVSDMLFDIPQRTACAYGHRGWRT